MKKYREEFFTFNLWFSYTISISASLFFVVFDYATRLDNIAKGFAHILFLLALSLAIASSVLAIFKPKLGGILQLVAGFGMVSWYLLQTPISQSMAIVYGLPYIVPGMFLLLPKRRKA